MLPLYYISAVGSAFGIYVNTAVVIRASCEDRIISITITNKLEFLCIAAIKLILLNICTICRASFCNIKVFAAVYALNLICTVKTYHSSV